MEKQRACYCIKHFKPGPLDLWYRPFQYQPEEPFCHSAVRRRKKQCLPHLEVFLNSQQKNTSNFFAFNFEIASDLTGKLQKEYKEMSALRPDSLNVCTLRHLLPPPLSVSVHTHPDMYMHARGTCRHMRAHSDTRRFLLSDL